MERPTSSWPKRDVGWEAALLARTQALLVETAERHGLHYVWLDEPAEALGCAFPAQAGLDFDLRFWLTDDEFGCSGDNWYAGIFPADSDEKWEIITRLVEGLVSGEARIALYRPLGRSKPFWTEAQLRRDGQWKSVSTGAGCAFPPIVRPTFLRNGHAPQAGPFRPGFGTIALLLLLAYGVHLLLR